MAIGINNQPCVKDSVIVRPIYATYINYKILKFHYILVCSECLFLSPPSLFFTMKHPIKKQIAVEKESDIVLWLLKEWSIC